MTSTLRRLTPRQRPAISVATSSVLLFPIRMFLGFGWIRASVEKVLDESWWNGDALRLFLIEQRSLALPFMEPFIDGFFEPFADIISLFVMAAQLAIGVAFVTTRKLRPALWTGVTLNVVFIAMGAVDPSVFYIVIQLSLLAAISLGVFGGERRDPNPTSLGLKIGAAAALAPLAMTVAPAEVIHDPAVILVTVALLAAATEALGWFVQLDDPRPSDPVVERRAGQFVTA
ncbi:MAG: hypothetical protein AB8G14_15740 [Ilumatobacter sp.]